MDEPIRIVPYKPHPSRRTHHLHLAPHESARFRDEIAFRDHLRSHPEAAAEYADLKRKLATRFENDREAYTNAKANFIGSVLSRSDYRLRTRWPISRSSG